jgi:hypothetical protein
VTRPPLPLGTSGSVRVYPTSAGYMARAPLHRDLDGKTRSVQRSGQSKAAARAALQQALRDRVRVGMAEVSTLDVTIRVAAERWYGGLTGKSPGTMQLYRVLWIDN